MDAQIGITLSKFDTSLLKSKTKGSLSDVVREMIANFDHDKVVAHLKTDRTTVRIDMGLAARVQQIADELDVQPARVARAIVETALYEMH